MAKPKKAETTEQTAAQKLVAFMSENKITMDQTYTLHVAEKFKNVCPQAVHDAISLGMIEAKMQLTVKDGPSQ